jgi:hypothetical protein
MELTANRIWLLGALWLALIGSCGDGKSSASSESSDDTSTLTDSETSGSTDSDWSECRPRSVSDSWFVVGPDALWGIYDPDVSWPPGHHGAVCVVDSVEHLTEISIRLRECQDDQAQPIALSLDLSFSSDVFTEAPPGIEVGLVVRVSYSTTIWVEGLHDAWYSLRDADTDELLLAAFADSGPTVVPKVAGEPDVENWLAPFEATLGAFGCAPEGELGCSDGAPQRAFVEFTRDGSAWDVLGATEGDLGDYRVHLGFAGTPGYCEGRPGNHFIEGIVIRKL